MKIKTFLAAILLSASAMAEINIGYTNETVGRNNTFRITSNTDQRLAVCFSADKLHMLKGKTISGIRIALGSKNSQNSEVSLFISTSLDSTPIITQTATITKTNQFVEYALSTPYTITGDEPELFIGCKMEIGSSYAPFSADFSKDIKGVNFAYGKDGWQDLYGKGYGCANIEAVIQEDLSFTDATLKTFSEDGFVKENIPYSYSLQLHNFGTKEINDFTVKVKVGESAEKSFTFSDCHIAPHATYDFSLNDIQAEVSGLQNLNVTVDVADDAEPTDNSHTTSAYYYPTDIQKNVLVEMFTGQTCTNCPSGHQSMLSAIQQTGANVIEICHHSGFQNDIFSMTEDWTLTSLYNGSTYAPAAMINRMLQSVEGTSPVFDCWDISGDKKALQSAMLQKPYVSISLDGKLDEASRQVTVNASIFTHEQMPGNDLRYTMWLIQDSIEAAQAGATADFIHYAVSRGCITEGAWGEAATFTPGETLNITKSFTLPDTIASTSYTKTDRKNHIATVLSNMKVVLFVHQNGANIANCQVFNCAETHITSESSETERLIAHQTYYGDNQGYEKETTATRTLDYYYDSSNRLSRIIEKAKDTGIDNWQLVHYFKYDYDSAGNLVRSNSLQYGQFDYGEMGFLPANDTILYEYNSKNQLTKETRPLKYFEYAYDSNGLLIEKSTWNINSITHNASNDLVEKYSDFNAFNRPRTITATSPTGKEWNEFTGTLIYDEDGNLTSERHYDADSILTYAEYWVYTNGILSEHLLPTVFGDGTEVENEKEVFTPVDGNPNKISRTLYLHNDNGNWDKMAGSICISDYQSLTTDTAPTITATAVESKINTVQIDVTTSATEPILLIRNGITIDTVLTTSAIDAEVENGTYEYFVIQGNRSSNIINHTHHVDLPAVKNLRYESNRQDFSGNTFVTLGWDNPQYDSALGFISNSLYFANMQMSESTTDSQHDTTLEADFGTSRTGQLFVQTRYKYGRINTPLLNIDLDAIPTGITTPSTSTTTPSTSTTEIGFPYVPQGMVIRNGKVYLKK